MRILVWTMLLMAITSTGNSAFAATAGQVTHLSGVLTAKRADGTSKLFSVRSEVQEGDTLTTQEDTYARVKFVDGAEIVLRPGSQLKVASYTFDAAKPASDNVLLDLLKGGLRAVTGLIGKRNHDAVNFATNTATIGIRGTHFGALLCKNDCGKVPTATGKPPANGLHLDVADGAIVVKNQAGQQVIAAGQFGFVASAAAKPIIVPPQQGIQVVMPTSISQNYTRGQGIGAAKDDQCQAN